MVCSAVLFKINNFKKMLVWSMPELCYCQCVFVCVSSLLSKSCRFFCSFNRVPECFISLNEVFNLQ